MGVIIFKHNNYKPPHKNRSAVGAAIYRIFPVILVNQLYPQTTCSVLNNMYILTASVVTDNIGNAFKA
jgi:hypothetical protein